MHFSDSRLRLSFGCAAAPLRVLEQQVCGAGKTQSVNPKSADPAALVPLPCSTWRCGGCSGAVGPAGPAYFSFFLPLSLLAFLLSSAVRRQSSQGTSLQQG